VLPRIEGLDVTNYLGPLGGTGLTAYVGLTRIARLRPEKPSSFRPRRAESVSRQVNSHLCWGRGG
jgi:hypothetical protein